MGKVNFEGLQILNLSENKISDTNTLSFNEDVYPSLINLPNYLGGAYNQVCSNC